MVGFMARIASGTTELNWAREQLSKAKTVDELRRAQAIFLPLELGLSLQQTALAIGRSISMTCKLRNRKRRETAGEIMPRRRKKELRNRAAMTLEKEAAILDELLANANNGGIVTIPALKPAFEKAMGRTVALSTLYRVLARHGWRKLAPDTQHPQGDPARREAWKKNSRPQWEKR
jgi:transposase